jgi:hypothetical protein
MDRLAATCRQAVRNPLRQPGFNRGTDGYATCLVTMDRGWQRGQDRPCERSGASIDLEWPETLHDGLLGLRMHTGLAETRVAPRWKAS